MASLRKIDDQEVLKQVLGGEVEAYRKLYRKYARMVHAMAMARIRDRRGAAEVVREVFVRAYDQLGSISHPVPRFGEMLQNLTLEACKERLLKTTAWILKVPPENAAKAGPALDLPAVFADLPDESVGLILAEQTVGVPLQYEVPFLLRFLEGMTYTEISRTLDIPISEVEELVDRGRRLHEREIRFHLEKVAGGAK
jgi:RNA polymerase sigma-70 factor (ECF subfamily)